MSMSIEEWRKGIEPWNNIKKQAAIDSELADLVLNAIEQKIKEMEMNTDGE